MKIKTSKDYVPSTEQLAFTDIVLNLFIFFFTAFSIVYTFNPLHRSTIPVKLPKAETAEFQKEEPIQVTVTADGKIYVGKRKILIQNLEYELKSLLTGKTNRVVVIRGDKEINYGLVMDVLDKAKLAGALKLGLAVEKKK